MVSRLHNPIAGLQPGFLVCKIAYKSLALHTFVEML